MDDSSKEPENSQLCAQMPVKLLTKPRVCYTCKIPFTKLHDFYDQLCPDCAALNWAKRNFMADLRGRVMIVTGARVKIGFQIALRLLRCGCHVIGTTRFPRDAATRFSKESDYESWKGSLDIIGLDLRDHDSIVDFVSFISANAMRLDAIIHNACQTIRRPPMYYQNLIEREISSLEQLRDAKIIQPLLEKDEALYSWRERQGHRVTQTDKETERER